MKFKLKPKEILTEKSEPITSTHKEKGPHIPIYVIEDRREGIYN